MIRWQTLLIIIGLLVGCSTSSDSEPEEIPNISVNANLPDSMVKDDLESIYISFDHPDGLSGEVSFDVNVTNQFTKQLNREVLWDTTFTPQLLGDASDLDATSSAVLTYDLSSLSSEPTSASGSRSLQLLESPYVGNVTINFYDAVTRQPISGSVTDQATEQSYDVVNGQWEILRSDKIRKDVLAEGLEIAIESEGRLPTVDVAVGEGRDHFVIPYNAENFSAEQYFKFLHGFPLYMDREEDIMTHSYPMNSTITVYVADRSTYVSDDNSGLERMATDDETLWMAEGFRDDMLYAIGQVKDVVPSNNDLGFETFIKSQSDFEFPLGFPDGTYTISSSPDNVNAVDNAHQSVEGITKFGFTFQRVIPGEGPPLKESKYIACQEVVETVAGLNTSDNPAVLCNEVLYGGMTPVGKVMSAVDLTFPGGSSWNRSISVTGVGGNDLNPYWNVNRE